MNKPKKSPENLVEMLKEEKGVSFVYCNEECAIEFLRSKNNYYRLASYRKNYDKKMHGKDAGKYIGLDFAHLIDLSTVDMHLRFLIIYMCLDIEHDLKVRLLNDITGDESEDGYNIVSKFLSENEYMYKDIYDKRQSTYVGDLIRKFFHFDVHKNANGNLIFDSIDVRCPIWAFVEIISFGSFLRLYKYYYDSDEPVPTAFLNPVKSLRNACAHNNCLINNLRSGYTKPGRLIDQYIGQIESISRDVRRKYLSVRPIFEFVNLLIVYDKIVSADIKKHRYEYLKEIVNLRMLKNAHYYENQQLLSSSYIFLRKVVDFITKT